MDNKNEVNWYVVKIRFNRALKALEDMAKFDIETYLPMEVRDVRIKGNKVISKQMPLFPSMIFVKTDFATLSNVCDLYKYFSYLSNKVDGFRRALKISDRDMTFFQEFVAENYTNIATKKVKFNNGEKVIVTAGVFKGSEAIFIKDKGKKMREYLIQIGGHYVTLMENQNTASVLKKKE